jgi:energy-coupling factor transporter ATP-binding protein EcfA2
MTSVPASTGIAARDVCKSFGDHLVLDKVSLAAEEGTILALLGPNGAGKTTMVRILSTLIPATPDPCASPVTTWSPTLTEYGPSSGSPASSQPWTTCSPAPRTCR